MITGYRPSRDDYATKGSDKGTLSKNKPSKTPKLRTCNKPCRICDGRKG